MHKSLRITFSEFEYFRKITKNLFSKYFDVNTYLEYKKQQNITRKPIFQSTNRITNFTVSNEKKSSLQKNDLVEYLSTETNSCGVNLRESISVSMYFSNYRDSKLSNNFDLENEIPDSESKDLDENIYKLNNDEEALCTICDNKKANLVLKCLVST